MLAGCVLAVEVWVLESLTRHIALKVLDMEDDVVSVPEVNLIVFLIVAHTIYYKI